MSRETMFEAPRDVGVPTLAEVLGSRGMVLVGAVAAVLTIAAAMLLVWVTLR